MSRSRKKTPIHGNTTVTSEKKDKQLASRAHRRAEKQAVEQGEEPPLQKETSDIWSFGKDGKAYWNSDYMTDEEIEKEMRK